MNIQITNYGLTVLNRTSQPFNIASFKLGSNYGYVPNADATDIRGSLLYESTPVGPITVNTNVYKYTVALDYDVGDFQFGEIAYFDSTGQCVAIAVSNKLISKTSQTNNTGNSMRIDTYLSMVGTQYAMWNDNIGSDIDFQVPVVKDVDLLPPVRDTDPNLYVIPPQSSNCSAILAYSAGNGLWAFDCYTYNNVQELTVVEATATSITFDCSAFTAEQKTETIPTYYGQKIVEFASGECFCTCRNVYTANVGADRAILTFRTPLAIVPQPGDLFYLFSRTAISVSNSILPIATKSNLGAVIIGDNLEITTDGVLSAQSAVTSVNGYTGAVTIDASDIPGLSLVATTGSYKDLTDKPSNLDFNLQPATSTTLGGVIVGSDFSVTTDGVINLRNPPITSINGVFPNEDGSITIETGGNSDSIVGLVNPKEILANEDLNDCTDVGLYYASAASASFIYNSPIQTDSFTVEVLPLINNNILQRAFSVNEVFVRTYDSIWSPWTKIPTSNSAIMADNITAGSVIIGSGLHLDENGKLCANVTSVDGSIGDITISVDQIEQVISELYNVEGGVPQLTKNPDTTVQNDPQFNRIGIRHVPAQVPVYLGEWNAVTNYINNDPRSEPDVGGAVTINVSTDPGNPRYETFTNIFAILKVYVPADAQSQPLVQLDSGLVVADGLYIASVGGRWINFTNPQISSLPTNPPAGTICYFNGINWVSIPKGKPGDVLTLNALGNPVWSTAITPSGGLHIN